MQNYATKVYLEYRIKKKVPLGTLVLLFQFIVFRITNRFQPFGTTVFTWCKFDECRPTLSQHLYLTHSNVCKYCWNHTDFIFEIRIEYTWKSIKTMLRLSWIKIPINTKQDKNESVVCIFCRRFLAITAIPVGLTLYMGYVDDITY